MACDRRDTEGDAVAAQVRRIRRLELDEVAGLLASARSERGDTARALLIEHHLSLALDAALSRQPRWLTFDEAFQEASVAITASVTAYLQGDGDAAGLRPYLEACARRHLATEDQRWEQQRNADRRLAADAEALEAAWFDFRRRTGRAATTSEIAKVLDWHPDQVELVSEMIAVAREHYDEEISAYVDDEG